MTANSPQVLSIVEAARLIYRTRSPDDKQIHRVYQQMKTGALKVRDHGATPLKWTTTEGALAEFLATNQIERTLGHPATEAAKRRSTLATTNGLNHPSIDFEAEANQLRDVYRGIWRDYFLAVMLRRRMAHRSSAFNRFVILGQAMLLLTSIGLMVGGLRFGWVTKPREHVAIEKWIDWETDEFAITRWHPSEEIAETAGSVIRVEYRYRKDSRRWIHTDRRFQVVDDEVIQVPD